MLTNCGVGTNQLSRTEEGGYKDSRRESHSAEGLPQLPCMNEMVKDKAERSFEPEPPTGPHLGPNVDELRAASWISP